MASSTMEGVSRASRTATTRRPRRSAQAEMGLAVGRIRGIEVRVDWSLLFVFALIAVNLGSGLFPAQHPDWSAGMIWVTAVLAALLFLGSVLAHELAHALVGRRQGVQVEGITLFIFGGMTRMRDEPRAPRAELLMAIVGPLTSLALGLLALVVAAASVRVSAGDGVADIEALPRVLGPVTTLLLWLGPINILLAIFNLVPAFPLDGGRVLRAILWRATGNFEKATQWASRLGRGFALLLVLAGAWMVFGHQLPILGGGLVQGLWLLLIGWFLGAAAIRSYEHVLLHGVVRGLPVARLMRPIANAVDGGSSVQVIAERFLASPSERCLSVVQGDRFLGVVCMSDLTKVPRADWTRRTAVEIMTPVASLAVATPTEDMADALRKLALQDVDQLPVVEKGEVRGLLRRADVIRWMEIQSMPV